jgi:hypothetical protein
MLLFNSLKKLLVFDILLKAAVFQKLKDTFGKLVYAIENTLIVCIREV